MKLHLLFALGLTLVIMHNPGFYWLGVGLVIVTYVYQMILLFMLVRIVGAARKLIMSLRAQLPTARDIGEHL